MRPAALYNVIAGTSWPILYGLYRLEARGLENLPEGGCVLACNHVSSFDPWPLGLPLWPKRWLRFMAKSELYWFPMKLVVDGAGAFPVKRGQRDTRRDGDGSAARARREHRRDVPGGDAPLEGTAEDARGAAAQRRGADRARGGRPARSRRSAGNRQVAAAREDPRRVREAGRRRRPRRASAPRRAQTATDRLMESIYELEASF